MTKIRKAKRCIIFYKIHIKPFRIEKYYMMCRRNRLQCMKLGFRHIQRGQAHFFYFMKKGDNYIRFR